MCFLADVAPEGCEWPWEETRICSRKPAWDVWTRLGQSEKGNLMALRLNNWISKHAYFMSPCIQSFMEKMVAVQ